MPYKNVFYTTFSYFKISGYNMENITYVGHYGKIWPPVSMEAWDKKIIIATLLVLRSTMTIGFFATVACY